MLSDYLLQRLAVLTVNSSFKEVRLALGLFFPKEMSSNESQEGCIIAHKTEKLSRIASPVIILVISCHCYPRFQEI